MSKVIVAIIGGLFDKNGISAYECPVLFGTVGDALTHILPAEISHCYFIGQIGERAPAGMQLLEASKGSRFAGLVELPEDYEHVLVLGAPLLPSKEEVFKHLVQTHKITGYDVTVLASDQMRCNTDAQSGLDSIYPAAVFTKEAMQKAVSDNVTNMKELVEAAMHGGIQQGVLTVGSAIEILDGISAYEAQKQWIWMINRKLIEKGVQLFDPHNTYISPDAEIEAGATILPGCHIRPGCKVGAKAVIGPNTILEKAEIGAGTTVNSSQVYESVVGRDGTVGPFAYIRPQCVIGDHCRIGDFVEIKKARIGDGTKVSHLTYIGDAVVGERVNFGCGTVIVNYDGYNKHQTNIGDDCFIGCNTNLVSPVTLEDGVFTAAGTTVTKDVPAGALVVGRARQTVLEGWNDKRRAEHGKK